MKTITCANCGMRIGEDEVFCPFCDQEPHEDPDAFYEEIEATTPDPEEEEEEE